MKIRILYVIDGMEFGGAVRNFLIRKMKTETIKVYEA
jgi:hypothetical protein